MLSIPLEVDYIHEPFNPDCGIPGIDQRYLYLRRGRVEDRSREKLIATIFSYGFSLKTGIYENDSLPKRFIKRIVGSRGPFYLRFAKLNPFHKAAVIKDPIGCLLTEYLALEHGVKPVVLVRHPIGFVASIMRIGWETSLDPISAQKELVEDYFPDEAEFLATPRKDKVESSAALWRALNKVLSEQCRRNPGWQVLTHEDMSRRPLETFRRLYRALGLPWSSRVERIIIKSTNSNNNAEAASGRVQDFKRNSAQIFDLRRNMLSMEERRKVFEITKDVAFRFYDEESFALQE